MKEREEQLTVQVRGTAPEWGLPWIDHPWVDPFPRQLNGLQDEAQRLKDQHEYEGGYACAGLHAHLPCAHAGNF